MIGCKCAIYQKGRFCLVPLAVQKVNRANKTISKYYPIKINQSNNQRRLIDKVNIHSAPSNEKQLLGKAKNAYKQITKMTAWQD